MNAKRILSLFLPLHFVLWTLAGLVRKSIAMDTAEAMVWGGEWTFGTNKHPFLSGWVAEAFHQVFGSVRLAAALAAAACTTLGIFLVWRLARRFADETRALVAALALEGCVYYAACALEFNCNMLSLVLVPAFLLVFHKAAEEDRMCDWLGTGLLAGALLMTKYTNGIFLLCAAVWSVCCRRDVFARAGTYVAAAVAVLVAVPHALYLFNTDFAVLGYFASRSEGAARWYGHLLSPLKFFGAQAASLWGVVALAAALFILRRRGGGCARGKGVPSYLLFTGLGPIAVLLLIAAVSGLHLKSMWGYAFAAAVPVVVVTAFGALSAAGARWTVRLAFAALVVQAAAVGLVQAAHVSYRSCLDARALAAALPAGTPSVRDAAFVGGDIWLCSQLSLNLPQRPRVVIEMDPRECPWIDPAEVRAKGCLVVTDSPSRFAGYRARFPALGAPVQIPIDLKTRFGKKKTRLAFAAILPPSVQGKEEQ